MKTWIKSDFCENSPPPPPRPKKEKLVIWGFFGVQKSSTCVLVVKNMTVIIQ